MKKLTSKKHLNQIRLEALVIHKNALLVIKRVHKNNDYYVLPGGGWESPETFEDGVAREVFEETSIKVKLLRMIFDLTIINNSRKIVYLCDYLEGEPLLGNYNEKISMQNDSTVVYQPLWLPLKKLEFTKLYTLEFRDWFLENYKNGQLPNNVERQKITLAQFGQS